MKKLLSDLNLKSFALVEFVLLILLVVLIPWSWKYALWVVGLLVLNTVAKCIAERRIGNSLLTKLGKWSLLLVALLIGWYAISMFWTADKELGGEMLTTKLSMLALVGVFLCSDMSYGDRRHFRIVMYAFVFSLVALFLTRLGICLYKVATTDKTLNGIIGYGFDTKRHHAYVALYVVVAIWWLYREWMEGFGKLPKWMKIVVPISMVCLVADVLMVDSRAGVLALWISAVLIPAHIIFIHKQVRNGIITFLISATVLVGVQVLNPKRDSRVLTTAKEVIAGNIVVEKVDKDKDKEDATAEIDSVAVVEEKETEAVEEKEMAMVEEKETIVEEKKAVAVEEKEVAVVEEKRVEEKRVEEKVAETKTATMVEEEEVAVVDEDALISVEEKDSVVEVAEADSVAEVEGDEKKEDVKQSDARFTIWKVALMVAKDEWVKGTGIGDRADEMEKKYKELGWDERRQNAHNQYLDTLVSTGVLGLILLLLMFLVPLRDALKQKSLVLGALVMVMAFNMLFETMFDRQMGLLFWGVMIGLLSMETAKNVSLEEAGVAVEKKEELGERK